MLQTADGFTVEVPDSVFRGLVARYAARRGSSGTPVRQATALAIRDIVRRARVARTVTTRHGTRATILDVGVGAWRLQVVTTKVAATRLRLVAFAGARRLARVERELNQVRRSLRWTGPMSYAKVLEERSKLGAKDHPGVYIITRPRTAGPQTEVLKVGKSDRGVYGRIAQAYAPLVKELPGVQFSIAEVKTTTGFPLDVERLVVRALGKQGHAMKSTYRSGKRIHTLPDPLRTIRLSRPAQLYDPLPSHLADGLPNPLSLSANQSFEVDWQANRGRRGAPRRAGSSGFAR